MRNIGNNKRSLFVATGLVAIAAVLGAITAGAVPSRAGAAPSTAAENGDGVDVSRDTPCARLLDALLFSDEPVDAIALQYELPTDVSVPAGVETGKRHCISRHEEDKSSVGVVLGIAIEDAQGDGVWVLLSDEGLKLDDITEEDWRESLATEGFTDLRKTPYGFTTVVAADSGPITNLWSALASDLRATPDE